MQFIRSFLLLFLFIVSLRGFAQTADSTARLSLTEAIQAAAQQNSAVLQSELDTRMAAQKQSELQDFFLPRAGFSFTAATANNPLQAFGMKLQEKRITAADFNPDLLNDPGNRSDFSTQLQLQQPVFFAPLADQRKGMNAQTEASKLVRTRTEEAVAYQTEKIYLQLQLVYASEKVLIQALETMKTIETKTDNYFKQGMVQKYDLLNAGVQVKNTETQLARIRTAAGELSDALSMMMGKNPGIRYITDSLQFSQTAPGENQALPDNRSDFRATEKMMESADWMIRSVRKSRLPMLNGFASYQINDNRLTGFGAGSYLAGLQLNWTISGGRHIKHQISQLEINKKQAAEKLNGMKREAASALSVANRKLNESAYSIRQTEAAEAQAAEALRVLQNRYAQGVAPTSDILLAGMQLSREQLNKLQALFDRAMAQLDIRFLTQHP